jgi:hypothetical protein
MAKPCAFSLMEYATRPEWLELRHHHCSLTSLSALSPRTFASQCPTARVFDFVFLPSAHALPLIPNLHPFALLPVQYCSFSSPSFGESFLP